MKRKIRLTESDLHKIVKESVKRILNEGYFDDPYGLHGKIARSGNGDAESYLRAGWIYDHNSNRWMSPEEYRSMKGERNDVNEGVIGNFFNNFRRSRNVLDAAPKGQRHRYSYNPQTSTYWYKDDNGGRHDTKVGYEGGRVGKNWNIFGNNNSNTQVSNGDLAAAQGQLRNWHRRNADSINQGNARAAQEQELQRRRERENFQHESPHRVGDFKTDQAGHTRGYFDDDWAYDSGLR